MCRAGVVGQVQSSSWPRNLVWRSFSPWSHKVLQQMTQSSPSKYCFRSIRSWPLRCFSPAASPSLMQFIPPQWVSTKVCGAGLLIRSLKRWEKKKKKKRLAYFPLIKLHFKLIISVIWCEVHLHKGFISTVPGVADSWGSEQAADLCSPVKLTSASKPTCDGTTGIVLPLHLSVNNIRIRYLFLQMFLKENILPWIDHWQWKSLSSEGVRCA